MPTYLLAFILVAVGLRFAALGISIRNEKRLKEEGGVEYGALTSGFLALTHIVYYLAAIGEGVTRAAPAGLVTFIGIALYILSMVALGWVIRTLGRFWTVKVIVAKDHELVTSSLFQRLRHPNYFLNILPELVGFALALQAWSTLVIGLPIYAVVLFLRIRQEEEVMRRHFPAYG